jgi:hypothetical protein
MVIQSVDAKRGVINRSTFEQPALYVYQPAFLFGRFTDEGALLDARIGVDWLKQTDSHMRFSSLQSLWKGQRGQGQSDGF